ncbi:MAG: guanylate kinase [Candidatus Woesearchaeota archaeon]
MNKLYAVLGPSGSGKSTLVNHMKEKYSIPEAISYTTRDMREGEAEGFPYYFVDEKEFKSKDFVEYVEYNGNFYGLTEDEIKDSIKNNRKTFVIVDKYGVQQLKELVGGHLEVIYIYSKPIECFQRMKDSRGIDQAVDRLLNSFKEKEYSNVDIADFVIINNDLEKAKENLAKIIEI